MQARGRYTFTREQALDGLGRSELGVNKSLMRLVRQRRLAAPRRGFYVIVPAEYDLAGSPPATWFIDDLMQFLGRPYYVGLLSAAAQHGAGHQQAQKFQVMTDVPLRPVAVGRVRIEFFKNAHLGSTPTLKVKTSTGSMAVSTPEATALDLVRYAKSAGHLGNVATVLAELAERLAPERLLEVVEATKVEVSVVQRLGFLLELVEHGALAEPLFTWVDHLAPAYVALRPDRPSKQVRRNERWRLLVNEDVEPDL